MAPDDSAAESRRRQIAEYVASNRTIHSSDAVREELLRAGYRLDEIEAVLHQEEDLQASVELRLGAIEMTVAAGRTAFLYQPVYVPVDSMVEGDVLGAFDLTPVQDIGLEGWEIVASVPRTIGVGLANQSIGGTFGTTWGAGLGGNVAGVYLLLRYSVSQENLEASRDVIVTYLRGRRTTA